MNHNLVREFKSYKYNLLKENKSKGELAIKLAEDIKMSEIGNITKNISVVNISVENNVRTAFVKIVVGNETLNITMKDDSDDGIMIATEGYSLTENKLNLLGMLNNFYKAWKTTKQNEPNQ